jgi:hypothetical protein
MEANDIYFGLVCLASIIVLALILDCVVGYLHKEDE